MENEGTSYFVRIGAALCLGATTSGLLVMGADVLTALGLGLVAAVLGGIVSWLWARAN